jgi:hypothetical protein
MIPTSRTLGKVQRVGSFDSRHGDENHLAQSVPWHRLVAALLSPFSTGSLPTQSLSEQRLKAVPAGTAGKNISVTTA